MFSASLWIISTGMGAYHLAGRATRDCEKNHKVLDGLAVDKDTSQDGRIDLARSSTLSSLSPVIAAGSFLLSSWFCLQHPEQYFCQGRHCVDISPVNVASRWGCFLPSILYTLRTNVQLWSESRRLARGFVWSESRSKTL